MNGVVRLILFRVSVMRAWRARTTRDCHGTARFLTGAMPSAYWRINKLAIIARRRGYDAVIVKRYGTLTPFVECDVWTPVLMLAVGGETSRWIDS